MNSSTKQQHNWILEYFLAGSIPCQKIQFTFNDLDYVIVFNLIEETHDENSITEKSQELNIDYRRNSYEMKFDLQSNFESEDAEFFTPPDKIATFNQLLGLGEILVNLLQFHYQNTHAESYFFVAADKKLTYFYNRIIQRYATQIGFDVRNNLGDEGLGYEINTPNFKRKKIEN